MSARSTRTPSERATRALVIGVLGRMTHGAVIVHDGAHRYLCGRPVPGERIPEMDVVSPELWRAFATEGITGLGRGWFSGWWACDGLDDLTSFLRVLLRNADTLERTRAAASRLSASLRHLQVDDVSGTDVVAGVRDRAQLVPLLDDTMTGSTALFASARATLAEAQAAKHDRMCRMLRLAPADHVLEVGAGLGSFALHAARTYGCRVTATTDTAAEADVAAGRVKEAGLEDLVTVVHEDHRDLTGTFDKVVALEALWQKGHRDQEAFLEHCTTSLLDPGGLLGLQCVVVADQRYERARRQGDFVTRYALPGASRPSVTSLLDAATRLGDLRLLGLDDIGQHRAETMRRWRARLADQRAVLDELGVDDVARRLIEFQLCYEEAACDERRTSAIQCVLARGRWRPTALSLPGR